MAGANEGHGWRYAVLVLTIALLALAGYIGYILYPRFDLPGVSGAGLLVLAAAAGLGSFFSPCSFPLLVTLLSREVQPDARGPRCAKASGSCRAARTSASSCRGAARAVTAASVSEIELLIHSFSSCELDQAPLH